MDRSQDFNILTPYLDKIKKIYAIGEVRHRIIDYAQKNNIAYEESEYLKDVLLKINNLEKGDIVLLSPGSASWDQYAKFEDRGNEFKEIINKL